MRNLNFQQKIQLESKNGIVLIKGITSDQIHVYAYIEATKQEIIELENMYDCNGFISLSNYKNIIRMGIGMKASKEHRAYMEQQYNFVSSLP